MFSTVCCDIQTEPTWILKQLAGNGDPPPLAPRDPWEKTTSDDTVGHMGQTQLSHDRRHLHRSQRS